MDRSRMEDLSQGLNEWRNIQLIVRETFLSVFEAIRVQGETISSQQRLLSDLQVELSKKVGNHDLNQAINSKANVAEIYSMNRRISSMNRLIDDKVDREELQFDLEKKADSKDVINRLDEVIQLIGDSAGDIQTRILQEVDHKLEFQPRVVHQSPLRQGVNESLQQPSPSRDIQALRGVQSGVLKVAEELDKLKDEQKSVKQSQESLGESVKDMAITVSDLRESVSKAHDSSRSRVPDAVSKMEQRIAEIEASLLAHGEELQSIRKKCSEQGYVAIKDCKERIRQIEADVKERWPIAKDETRRIDRIVSQYETLRRDIEAEKTCRKKLESDILECKPGEQILRMETAIDRLEARCTPMESDIKRFKRIETITDDHSKKLMEIESIRRESDASDRKISSRMEQLDAELNSIQSILEDEKRKVDRIETLMDTQADDKRTKMRSLEEQFEIFKSEVRFEMTSIEKDANAYTDAHCETMAKRIGEKLETLRQDQRYDESSSTEIRLKRLESEIADIDLNMAEVVKKSDSHGASIKKISKGMVSVEDIDSIWDVINKKANREDFHRLKQDSVEELKKQLVSKVSIKEVTGMLEMKANLLEVNSVISEINMALERLEISHGEIRNSRRILGRWIWKSGKTKSGHAVPWNVQTVNTDSRNFLWEKDKSNVIVVMPGVYVITFGFFCKKKPRIEVMVNGHSVFLSANGSVMREMELAGVQVTGTTFQNFLCLPGKCRISLTFSGDVEAEGFFGLEQL